MKIRNKMLICALITIICVGLTGLSGFLFTNRVANISMEFFESQAVHIKLDQIEQLTWEIMIREIVHCAVSDPEAMVKIEKEAKELSGHIPEFLKNFSEIADSLELQQEFEKFSKIKKDLFELSSNYAKEDAIMLAVRDGREVHKNILSILRSEVESHEKQMSVLRDNAFDARKDSIMMIVICTIIAGFLVLTAVLWISGSISRPVNRVVEGLKNIAQGEGDFTIRLDIDTKDEVGELAKWFNLFAEKIRGVIQKIKENMEKLHSASGSMNSISRNLADDSGEMKNQADKVSNSASRMSANINSMASASEEMSANAQNVSAGAVQMSYNMNSVASAVEEMSVSIGEIAESARNSNAVSSKAKEMSLDATEVMASLGDAAKEIGQVTSLIKRIAEQTNLLALNATIEAASAGDAGRGFAVVANEIKELAGQSARAAEDIAGRIQEMQKNTGDAVKVIDSVSEIINTMNRSVSIITSSVEQMTQSANEISANISQANTGVENIASSIAEVAKGSNDVARNAGEASLEANEVADGIVSVKKAAENSDNVVQEMNKAAEELAWMSANIQKIMGQFKI